MKDVFKRINAVLELKNISEYRIMKLMEDNTLVLIASFDFGYYHNVEIYFKDTSYISCPVDFCDATFRLANHEEIELIKPRLFDGIDDIIVCIVINENTDKEPIKHFIVAKSIEYKVGTVYYYKRENLNEGERIADWVK